MPKAKNNNGNSNGQSNDLQETTLKEAASTLGISESTVKRYLKDFDLTVKGTGSKAVILPETMQALSEIAKLRANGLSVQEIKELKKEKPSKHVLDELEEPVIQKTPLENEQPIEEITEVSKAVESLGLITGKEDVLEAIDTEDLAEETGEIKEISEDIQPEDETGLGEEPRRRRGFNYRYVERQISNDSKRVMTLRQRLKNPNISIQDKLFFEEALERRILFLNGWKHILKWISKK